MPLTVMFIFVADVIKSFDTVDRGFLDKVPSGRLGFGLKVCLMLFLCYDSWWWSEFC